MSDRVATLTIERLPLAELKPHPRNGNDIHPTVKPLGLVARQIWNSSRKDDVVLEMFGGSGTTIVAAHQTGRRAVATELEPMFAAVILQRLKEAGLEIRKVDHVPAV